MLSSCFSNYKLTDGVSRITEMFSREIWTIYVLALVLTQMEKKLFESLQVSIKFATIFAKYLFCLKLLK